MSKREFWTLSPRLVTRPVGFRNVTDVRFGFGSSANLALSESDLRMLGNRRFTDEECFFNMSGHPCEVRDKVFRRPLVEILIPLLRSQEPNMQHVVRCATEGGALASRHVGSGLSRWYR